MMKADAVIALERVQSEALSVLMSIQSHREVSSSYFDRLRGAVQDAVQFFADEEPVPTTLLSELEGASQVLRNEATAFPGRTVACIEMADWLIAKRQALVDRAA